ncbi:MAG: hypothetical protein ACR2PH_06455 [Desulfobulbia bacterium]
MTQKHDEELVRRYEAFITQQRRYGILKFRIYKRKLRNVPELKINFLQRIKHQLVQRKTGRER